MLQSIVDWFIYSVFKLNPESRLGTTINFFVYDVVKILLLLFIMIAIVGFLRTFLPQYKVKKWLAEKKGFGNLFAAFFGAITPFCSCSSIPIFLSFLKSGVPLGITFSFLITSPMINEYLVVLMLGFFGWRITFLYVLSGLFIGTVSGVILGKMNLEKYIARDITSVAALMNEEIKINKISVRISFGLSEARMIIKKIWLWILLGVGVGALIHNYIPQEIIQGLIKRGGLFSVPIAAILGVPMYGNCAAIVPIAVALFRKGIPLGTALAFMMATAALSLPEAVILKRALALKLIIVFFSVVTLGIIITGYLFNLLQMLLM